MSMFCGLPMSVAAEPTLAAQASPSRYGTGSRPRRTQISHSTGATARQTTSLLKTAESAATAAIIAASSGAAANGSDAMRNVTHA